MLWGRTGVVVLKRALEAPTRQIAEKSNLDGGVVADRMGKGMGNFGLDAAKGEYMDLITAGIIDPTKVVRTAIENAVSVASVLLLTEATPREIPEPEKESARNYEMSMGSDTCCSPKCLFSRGEYDRLQSQEC